MCWTRERLLGHTVSVSTPVVEHGALNRTEDHSLWRAHEGGLTNAYLYLCTPNLSTLGVDTSYCHLAVLLSIGDFATEADEIWKWNPSIPFFKPRSHRLYYHRKKNQSLSPMLNVHNDLRRPFSSRLQPTTCPGQLKLRSKLCGQIKSNDKSQPAHSDAIDVLLCMRIQLLCAECQPMKLKVG